MKCDECSVDIIREVDAFGMTYDHNYDEYYYYCIDCRTPQGVHIDRMYDGKWQGILQ